MLLERNDPAQKAFEKAYRINGDAQYSNWIDPKFQVLILMAGKHPPTPPQVKDNVLALLIHVTVNIFPTKDEEICIKGLNFACFI